MTIKTIALAFSFAFAVPAVVHADGDKAKETPAAPGTAKTGTVADADLQALAHVQAVNKLEIDLGKLAQKQGASAEVKKFGAMLVTDHQNSDKEVMALAKKLKAKVPAEAPDAAKAADVAKLKTLKGAEFDREYLRMMAAGHEEELAKSDPTISQVGDADVKQLLQKRKTTLQKHADHAKNAQIAAG